MLLAERRDPTQGALLRHWLQQAVVPAFAGRILAVDVAVALRSVALHGPDPKPFHDGLIAATALVHSLVVDTRNLADFEATGVGTPPTVLLLCLWAWRGLSVWRPCGRVLKSAASLRQVKVLWALGRPWKTRAIRAKIPV